MTALNLDPSIRTPEAILLELTDDRSHGDEALSEAASEIIRRRVAPEEMQRTLDGPAREELLQAICRRWYGLLEEDE